jgi:hypothetical protein
MVSDIDFEALKARVQLMERQLQQWPNWVGIQEQVSNNSACCTLLTPKIHTIFDKLGEIDKILAAHGINIKKLQYMRQWLNAEYIRSIIVQSGTPQPYDVLTYNAELDMWTYAAPGGSGSHDHDNRYPRKFYHFGNPNGEVVPTWTGDICVDVEHELEYIAVNLSPSGWVIV